MATEPVTATLQMEGAARSFGARRVFTSITARATTGQVLAVTGANGSGKSTLLRVVAGLLAPTRGVVALQVGGVNLGRTERRRYIGFTAPGLVLYPLLTAREQLQLIARLHGAEFGEPDALALLTRVGLDPRRADRLGDYSSGMLARLKLACALVHAPPILLLDEPTSTLDPDGVAMVRQLIAAERANKLILLATNNPDEAAWADSAIELTAAGSTR